MGYAGERRPIREFAPRRVDETLNKQTIRSASALGNQNRTESIRHQPSQTRCDCGCAIGCFDQSRSHCEMNHSTNLNCNQTRARFEYGKEKHHATEVAGCVQVNRLLDNPMPPNVPVLQPCRRLEPNLCRPSAPEG